MTKGFKFAIATAVVGSLALAAVGESLAAPVLSTAIAVKAAPAAATNAQYWAYDYGYGPYAYRPAYRYGGHTYWYPTYPAWDSTWSTGNGYY